MDIGIWSICEADSVGVIGSMEPGPGPCNIGMFYDDDAYVELSSGASTTRPKRVAARYVS